MRKSKKCMRLFVRHLILSAVVLVVVVVMVVVVVHSFIAINPMFTIDQHCDYPASSVVAAAARSPLLFVVSPSIFILHNHVRSTQIARHLSSIFSTTITCSSSTVLFINLIRRYQLCNRRCTIIRFSRR